MQGMQPPEENGSLTYIKGGALIDGNGGAPLKDPVIAVQGRRITEVGTRDEIRIPRDANVIDAGRCVLMPGMMDLHIHTSMFNCMTFHNHRVAQFEIMPHLQQMYALFHAQLCFDMGFTTLRDLGMNSNRGLLTNELCAVRDAIDAGIMEGPRMLIGGFTTLIVAPLALLIGVAAGYVGGRLDDATFFVVSTLASMPSLLLLIALIMVLGTGPVQVCIALGVTGWVGLARLVRAETLKIRELDYVAAARVLGVSEVRIVRRHVIPNLTHLVVVSLVLSFLVVFKAEFAGVQIRGASEGPIQGPVVETLLAYLVAFVVAACLLAALGEIDAPNGTSLAEST